MEELLEDIRLLLGTLGYPILEPLLQASSPNQPSSSHELSGIGPGGEFVFAVHKLKAFGVQGDEGFVLRKGSTASKSHTDSLNQKLVKLREQLISDGRLVDEGTHLRLTQDVLISSSSYAAALIAGTSRSGPQSWIATNGKSMKELEDIAAENVNAANTDNAA